jgi:hypothetical protein
VATASVVYQEEAPSNIEASPPTGITVERLPESTILTVERIPVTLPAVIAEDNSLVGYNVYASTQQGGGTVGYSRVNLSLVTDFTETTRDVPIATLEASNTLATGATAVRVRSTQEDRDQNTVSVEFDETVPLTSGESQIYSRVELYDRQTRRFYSFEHNRSASAPTTIFNGTFSALPDTDPLFYVVTAVYFDPTTGLEVESSYSPEVSASPIRVSTDIGVFPVVKREDIVKDIKNKSVC